jgi:hypothetical protein
VARESNILFLEIAVCGKAFAECSHVSFGCSVSWRSGEQNPINGVAGCSASADTPLAAHSRPIVKSRRLIRSLVSAGEHCRGNGQVQLTGGFQVDVELESRGLLDWKRGELTK